MVYVLLGIGILVCAVLAVVSKRLLISAIWLALTSALVSIILYLLGAHHIAVIELSVGAGLVTVLFVFAINIAGEDITALKSIVPKPIALALIIGALALLVFLVLRAVGVIPLPNAFVTQSEILWQSRYLDLLLQIALIFAGVLGVLGLLADSKPVQKAEVEEEEEE